MTSSYVRLGCRAYEPKCIVGNGKIVTTFIKIMPCVARRAKFYLNEHSNIRKVTICCVVCPRRNGCRVIKIILTTMSAGLPVVTLTDSDIPGSHLDEPYDKHTVAALRWWLLCRGVKALNL